MNKSNNKYANSMKTKKFMFLIIMKIKYIKLKLTM